MIAFTLSDRTHNSKQKKAPHKEGLRKFSLVASGLPPAEGL